MTDRTTRPPLPPGYSWTKEDDGGGAPAIITPRPGVSISGRFRGERNATMAARAEDAWSDHRREAAHDDGCLCWTCRPERQW